MSENSSNYQDTKSDGSGYESMIEERGKDGKNIKKNTNKQEEKALCMDVSQIIWTARWYFLHGMILNEKYFSLHILKQNKSKLDTLVLFKKESRIEFPRYPGHR